ncbi:MAG: glycosyltransferase family 4 protein [Candidatus Omnitrophica bacterium]|nr:glycosyltransferase family 4 protein [Candidatus Omnitrophota bacterium]
MDRLKIAEVVTRMDWGGSPDIIMTICTALDKTRYDIKLIIGPTEHPSVSTKKFLEEFKNNLIVVPWLRRDINPWRDLFAFFRLYSIFRREKFYLVHTHTAKAGALARPAAYLAGTRRIIHMPHGHNFYGYFNPVTSRLLIFIERFLSRFTTKIVVLSESEKRDLVEFGVAEKSKIRGITSGLSLGPKDRDSDLRESKRMEFNLSSAQKIVGMVSRLEPVKGPSYFIRAVRGIAEENPQVKFIIVGDGSLRRRLERDVKRWGLNGRVIFTGWRDDVLDIISFLDILVQPSLNEAIGRVLIEAQGMGVPVVATRVGGIPEVVRENITGLLVPSRDSEKLKLAISSLLKNEKLRNAMSAAAREWVSERFSVKKMVSEIDSIYSEVAQ